MRRLFIFLFVFFSFQGFSHEIPDQINFAGIRLEFSESVKRLLKADVELITKNQKYFQTKVERADLYFPIVEKIFREEGFPEDFKFLALQESSLVADAVSSSNAVGYWQFKKESAQEVGLRVDNMIDERMNIVSSSRGASAYIKKNNAVLNNWVYALLSYNLGLGGVKSHVKDKYRGASSMKIDDDMHWYVIRFLAHKLAFENSVGKGTTPFVLIENNSSENRSLKDISEEYKINLEELKSYNKWLKCERVPTDKMYSVLVPVSSSMKDVLVVKNDHEKIKIKKQPEEIKIKHKPEKAGNKVYKAPPLEFVRNDAMATIVYLNRIRVVQAKEGDDPTKLAMRAGIPISEFLFFNELRSFDKIVPGQFYYLQPKRSKALVPFDTVQAGESLKDISQKYGINIRSIRKKNHLQKNDNPQAGLVLWLRKKRPKNIPPEIIKFKNESPGIIPSEKQKPAEKDSLSLSPKRIDVVVPQEQKNTSGLHQVQPKETMYSISRMYGVSADSIIKWNNLTSNELKIGQELIVRSSSTDKNVNPQYSEVKHEVKQGETIYGIARQYGVTVTEIKSWNGKASDDVKIGEVIIIKKKI